MMNRREKQALDRWLTREPPTVPECENCGGEGDIVLGAGETAGVEAFDSRQSVECPVCGGTGDAPIVDEVEGDAPQPCPVCEWVGCHEAECRLADAETCADCGMPLDPADKDEEGLAGWTHVFAYGDEAYHHSCIETRRRADEKEYRSNVEAWERDPVAQAQEQADRIAHGDVDPVDLESGPGEPTRQ